MNPDDGTGANKRRYGPTQPTRVRLVPDEAVLAFCRNNATAGPTAMGSHNAS